MDMRRILITIIMMLPFNMAFADSYIMISPNNITNINCTNNNVVSFNVLSTLMNEKKSIILTSLSDGTASLTVNLKHKKCDYKIVVKNGKMDIKGDKFIKILPVDLPPELNATEETK